MFFPVWGVCLYDRNVIFRGSCCILVSNVWTRLGSVNELERCESHGGYVSGWWRRRGRVNVDDLWKENEVLTLSVVDPLYRRSFGVTNNIFYLFRGRPRTRCEYCTIEILSSFFFFCLYVFSFLAMNTRRSLFTEPNIGIRTFEMQTPTKKPRETWIWTRLNQRTHQAASPPPKDRTIRRMGPEGVQRQRRRRPI